MLRTRLLQSQVCICISMFWMLGSPPRRRLTLSSEPSHQEIQVTRLLTSLSVFWTGSLVA